jgi:hypothetical protein
LHKTCQSLDETGMEWAEGLARPARTVSTLPGLKPTEREIQRGFVSV